MFVDKARVEIKAGKGGNGLVSFRREKFIDRGGPNGGDGGNGGNVILVASQNENTLASFRYQRLLKAEDGQNGAKRNKHGKSGNDLEVKVPIGTQVINSTGKVIADLIVDGQRLIIANGGKGGYGNAHFVSSTRRAPNFAEKGEAGDQLEVSLELKMIADIGLVGLPNAGKSTLLARLSNARPEIASYPFTTLIPNLGVVDLDSKNSLLFADIPGLIEGAAEGKGLGDEFLRHIERTAVIVHLIDAYQADIVKAYQVIQAELKAYKINLTNKPQVVVVNKIEGLNQDVIRNRLATLTRVVPKNTTVLAISAKSGLGLKEFLNHLSKLVKSQREITKEPKNKELPILRLSDTSTSWRVVKTKNGFEVTGRKIERFAARTDFSNPQAINRLREIMRKMGIIHELERQKIKTGQKITIGGVGQFEY